MSDMHYSIMSDGKTMNDMAVPNTLKCYIRVNTYNKFLILNMNIE
jgi:hypothetical protein